MSDFLMEWNLGNILGGSASVDPNKRHLRNIIATHDEGCAEAGEDMEEEDWEQYQLERKKINTYLKNIEEEMAENIIKKFGDDKLYEYGWEIMLKIIG